MAVILIAEDHLPTQTALRTLLRINGYQAIGACNGREALEYIQAHPVDLLLLDLMMPIMGGIEVLKTLRSDKRFNDVPVLVYSASDEAAYRDEALGAGANEYIVKSQIDWKFLSARLSSYLND